MIQKIYTFQYETENVPPGFCNLVLFQADFSEQIALKLVNPGVKFSVLGFSNPFCIFVITTSYDIQKNETPSSEACVDTPHCYFSNDLWVCGGLFDQKERKIALLRIANQNKGKYLQQWVIHNKFQTMLQNLVVYFFGCHMIQAQFAPLSLVKDGEAGKFCL